jgi:hypothetical protein
MMIAEYPANCACVFESHVDGAATVTDKPKADACCASTLLVPPFTDVDKISTDPDNDALAGADATATLTAVTAAAPATTVTGIRADPAPVTGTVTNATSRRHCNPAIKPHPSHRHGTRSSTKVRQPLTVHSATT